MSHTHIKSRINSQLNDLSQQNDKSFFFQLSGNWGYPIIREKSSWEEFFSAC